MSEMLGYVTFGTNDLEKAGRFYDALLAPLGARRLHSFDRGVFYGESEWDIAILKPLDGQPATPGNGVMAALRASSRAVVDEVHARALSLGGSDEGGPGIRGREERGFYAAYFRDPEGNKLCVFRMGAE